MKKYKHAKEKKATEKASFYIATSVCLMAVGMAVWSTYSALSGGFDTTDSTDGGYFSSLSGETVAAAMDMTGVTEAPTEINTQASVAPTERNTQATEAAQSPQKPRGAALSETMPAQTEESVSKGAMTSVQAVLKVSDSLVYPVKSRRVTKEYSENSVYSSTMKDYRAHTGCDFEAAEGESVYAMSPGTVADISVSELYGVIVEVDCGDYSVYYCGLSNDFAVEKGDELKSGDTVGTVGTIPSESADGTHVHIEIRAGGRLIDPLSVIENDG